MSIYEYILNVFYILIMPFYISNTDFVLHKKESNIAFYII
jgi:hypothetical protein